MLLADHNLWLQRLRVATGRSLQVRTFAAFNTNVDAIVHLSPAGLARAIDKSGASLTEVERRACTDLPVTVSTPTDFLVVLRAQLAEGKSCHVVVEDSLLGWVSSVFPEVTESLGGQAGIIANQMAALQAASTVYTSLLSSQQARLFDCRVCTPVVVGDDLQLQPVREAVRPGDAVKVNWIFEYTKGLRFQFGSETVTTPRANRVIMATRPSDAVMSFDSQLDEHLPALGQLMDVAFMAGYHYAAPEGHGGRDFASYLAYTKHSLWQLTRRNPYLRIHYEYVPAKHEELEPEVLRGVCEMVHSFGINEHEIRRVLRQLGHPALADAIEASERAYTLYQGAQALLTTLQLDRVHVHNLGYYVVVLRKPYPVSLHEVLNASLYASAVNVIKAKYGGYPAIADLAEAAEMPLSETGYAQLDSFAIESRRQAHQIADGIWEYDDHYALVVPAHVFPNPVSTVGMGDTISSASYAMEAHEIAALGAGKGGRRQSD
jgi:ADP-dependent phosphofructokinase/glucokinase